MVLLQITILVLSIMALYWGAEFTLESGEKVGHFLGLSPLVIGLLLIGFGTSLPEFFVSQMASYQGEVDMALGNILGSNIANLFLVLGVSGMIATLDLQKRDIKRQIVIHLALTIILALVITFVGINLISTLVFTIFFGFYLFDTFRFMEEDDSDGDVEELQWMDFVKLMAGFALLYIGGDFLVSSGSKLGELLGVSSFVISAILVAFGTSFPEMVTAILACVKKKDTHLITGNIIGSNIFNVAFVLGSVGFYEINLQKVFIYELAGLGVAALMLLGLMLLKKNFGKIAGLLYLISYGVMIGHWLS